MPTSTGRVLVNEFCDKLSTNNWERLILGMAPLILFSEMSKYCKYLQFPKLDGMFPSKLFCDR